MLSEDEVPSLSRVTLDQSDIAHLTPDRRVLALVVSSPDDNWLMPDEPFRNAGCQILRAVDLPDASEKCHYYSPDLLFLPLTVGGQNVTDQIGDCQSMENPPVIIVVASNDQINAAAEAMRAGAYDCLFRPFSNARLTKAIANAMSTLKARDPGEMPLHPARPIPESPPLADNLPADPGASSPRQKNNMLAVSPQMSNVIERARAIAPSDASVFVTGEIGTGKSELARLIHASSPRAHRPWYAVNCATLTPKKFESDFLDPQGAAARAEGGTLYLNEICELSREVQPLLLHLLNQESTGNTPVPFRFIASTRHDARETIRQGQLRADLFYRLHVAPIALPPLRDRAGDIAHIARTKLPEFAEAEGRGFQTISASAMELMEAYFWPGNLRELLNVLWTAVLLHNGDALTPEHLPEEIRRPAPEDIIFTSREVDPNGSPDAQALVGLTLAEIEQTVIEATIKAEGGSIPRAARVLDVSPSTIYRKRENWERKDGV
ncbi:MAG: sigma 54-interacting transcriptional regulator [Maritimibacter sp.]